MDNIDLPGSETPVSVSQEGARFGSDAVADVLHALDLPFIALNPGASYRGLHDSIVNYLGNTQPRMLLCLHEEHAVALAHGWAKVTDKAMAVALHSNVGLMHATMAIYNAWCDRAPMLILGATGAVDAAKRRPWIEWIHTSRDQAALVRDYVKWDDQPASLPAAREALYRAAWLTAMVPRAPVYVVLGVELQEEPAPDALPPVDPRRLMPGVQQEAGPGDLGAALAMLRDSTRPLILAGRVSRSTEGWNARIRLAEALGAQVATDTRVAAAFPTDHPLHLGPPGNGFVASDHIHAAIRDADVILSLDWLDLAGSLAMTHGDAQPSAKIIQVSLDHVLHNGWSFDHMGLPTVDLMVSADPDWVVEQMVAELGDVPAKPVTGTSRELLSPAIRPGPIATPAMARALRDAVGDRRVSILQLPLSWDTRSWHWRHPLDYIGSDGGGGIGSGPGLSVGAALALRGTGRLPIAIFGDGNYTMGCTALWTAVHYRIPLMIVVTNNQSFYNDELHQERMARHRNRPVENKWIGQRMTDPDIDLATLARGQGAMGFGPIADLAELPSVFAEALKKLEAGQVVVVDVRVMPGYAH